MAKKLWGTRFPKRTSMLTDKFTSSISFDKRLAKYDILGSIAHAKMLGIQKIIPKKDSNLIVKGLNSILKELKQGKFRFDQRAEDIHSNIQDALFKKIGKPAFRLHTARSRNDQIVFDVKMYMKDEIDNLAELITELEKAILKLAKNNSKVIIPGYTHLQVAQCVLLSHHLLSYIEGLERDKSRLSDARVRIDSMPLGACAFSGTGLNIDRNYVAKELGFKSVTANSIDSVSDRDFIIEVLAALSMLSVHLSRMAEDLILWSTKEFSFIDIDFSFCTGSSIMPHKKNPDILELIRGSVGKIQGDLSSVLILMKGLPSSYNRDLQLDKPPLFDAVDTVSDILEIFIPLFENIVIEKEAITARLTDESLFSVDIVEYLIKKGVSYREAHDIVGKMIRDCLDRGKKISFLSVKELKRYSSKLEPDFKKILNAWASVSLKESFGGTSPKLVAKQLDKWGKKLQ
ncbi:MAG: argininosuccinate lyase [Candidatus Omnitrophica bacterium CG08_land_8_20_14_0_20_41_16]|uniref:Argininosuccinate lyase n=1 Tax=Candidatus Sherwoodlollariibacterium unditelluris TaxID=1974757 RepID=A0A2G9YKZ4_9BACT|nr:MAG: argininosuccinate lyase [Candidatus Omnitrophica bacterium CG23_combo_of_CG06-09_8_20_14_all_41_10]PIS33394.1 MAG: argininosuccinate lyase [Candidatus Omnitrophica bacterium CG08_land_8_20_14_0_20_41_16]